MIIDLKKLSDQAIESTTGTNKMRMFENAQSMVFQLFTKNVYSNPIGTVVREITSNCFDSHVEANVNAPVIIRKSIDTHTNTTNISFIDYGVGMSPDRVQNIYGVYFESTKRDNNDQIGGFGIGGKTPLAYKRSTGAGEGEYDNSFYLITVFDKVKYFYCIYEGSESPQISLLHSEPTIEGNGTEVRIPVLGKDMTTFKKEMVRQLYYFENIIFEGFDDEYDSNDKILSNEYQIVRAKSFLFRGNNYSSNVHVCLGRVAYPIDYSILGVDSNDYQFPIALRLEVGDINVTVSREQLDYSESTVKFLKKKLEECKNEIKSLVGKQYESIVTLEDYFKVMNGFGKLEMPNGQSFGTAKMIKIPDINFSNFKYNSIKIPNDKALFRFFFENRMYGKREPRRRYYVDAKTFQGGYEELVDPHNHLYYFEDKFERKIIKQAWLLSEHIRYNMLSKKDILHRHMRSDVAEVFNVHDLILDDNNNPTTFGKTLIDLQDDYFELIKKNAIDYNSIVVPDDFIIARKNKGLSKDILDTTILLRFGDYFYSHRVKLEVLFQLKCPIYYGTRDEETLLKNSKNIFELLFNEKHVITAYNEYDHKFKTEKGKIMFIMVAKNNLKYMQYCHNAQHINTFKTKMLRRKEDMVLKHFQNESLREKYSRVDTLYRSEYFNKISPSLATKIKTVEDYVFTSKKTRDLSDYIYELKRFFPIDSIKPTKEQGKYDKLLDDVLEMQVLNEDVLQYINKPYSLSDAKDSFWNLLKTVLVY